MNEVVEFEWSESLGKASLDAYYKVTLGHPLLILFAWFFFWALAIVVILAFPGEYGNAPVVFLLMGSPWIALWLKSAYEKKRALRDIGKQREVPTIKVVLTDETLAVSASGSSETIKWDCLTKVKQVDRFLFLFEGKTVFQSLPCEYFKEDQIEFIKSKINGENRGYS